MSYPLRHAVGAVLALSVLLGGVRTAYANDAENSAPVRVKFEEGSTQLAPMEVGRMLTPSYHDMLKSFPKEIGGLVFTLRSRNQTHSVAIDAPARATVYLMFGDGNDENLCRSIVEKAGWSRIGTVRLDKNGLAVYKMVFDQAKQFTVAGTGLYGVVVSARNLALDSEEAKNVAKKPDEPTETPAPESTLHEDPSPQTASIPGPSTHPAQPQATVNALEVYEMDNGMMLGQTSEATLTLTSGDQPQQVAVRFVTKIGNEMSLARDDALRFIHLKYPNWDISRAEITFEDKYVAHDGGSIGTALGTLILSCIQGFTIDPNAAITGDISANGKTRAIGGVSAKIKGATASKCTIVAIPTENSDQLIDAVIYNGPEIIRDIQVIGINNLDDAVATMRIDRDPKLAQAITLFVDIQKTLKDKPTSLNTKGVQDKLEKVLQLAPQHLSAQVLLSIAQGKQPKTLSPVASRYYAFLSVGNMVDVLKQRSDSGEKQSVPSSVVRTGLANLRKLRPLADENVRPMIDAWCRFIEAWNSAQQGYGSARSVETQRQSLLDEMAKENADADLMQKMLKEGL